MTSCCALGSSSGSSDDEEEGGEGMTAKNFLKKEAVPEANKFLKGAKGSGVRTHTQASTHAHARTYNIH